MTPYYDRSGVTIHNGDCAEVMAQMPAESIDMALTSPPYDNLRTYNGYTFDFPAIAAQLWRLMKPGGVLVWVVGDATIDGSETLTSFKQAIAFRELGFNLHDTMIYEKLSGSAGSNFAYWQAFEYMFVLSKGRPNAINLISDRKNVTPPMVTVKRQGHRNDDDSKKSPRTIVYREYGIRYNIWRYNTGKGACTPDSYASDHPAIFPEALARDHILSWSNPGDTVLDPMCGSGTTLKMAKLLGRPAIGIDISAEYCAISQQRVAQEVLAL